MLVGSPDSREALLALAADCDVVTFDHELVAAEHLAALAEQGHRLAPSAHAMGLGQDKLRQRVELAAAGLPVPAHRAVATTAELERFAGEHGWPIVAKAARGGYDGRGVWMLAGPADCAAVIDQARAADLQLIVEAAVPIERELAVLVARRRDGEAITYPVVETIQRDGICVETLAPAPIPARLADRAREIALRVAEHSEAVGVMAIELFLARGELLINELAPRVHNSGHWTIEGARISQFEQHLRAILDWPLGMTDLVAPAIATVNVLGPSRDADPADALARALAVPGAHVHLYGKRARAGRKLGHVTALGSDAARAQATARRAHAALVSQGAR